MRRTSLLAVAAVGLVLAPEASAHAEITPARVPANSVTEFVLSVAGEENAPTVKVSMQVPAGLGNVKPLPARGWEAELVGRVITWSGGRFPQGESGEFTITAQFPNTPGARLKFPTVQTYGNGTIARWIGAPSSDTPAPTILLTAAQAPVPPPPPPSPPVTTTTTTTATTAATESDDDEGSAGWVVGGVVALILVGAGVALLWRRRP
jgi:uncharacterized protein YcnI